MPSLEDINNYCGQHYEPLLWANDEDIINNEA
jgi:hypothetical protein